MTPPTGPRADLLVLTQVQKDHTVTIEGQPLAFSGGRARVPSNLALKLCGSRPGYRLGEPLAPFAPETWREGSKLLLWDGTFAADTGYGSVATMMVNALTELGVTVCATARTHRTQHLSDAILEVLARPPRFDVWGVRHSQVDEFDQLATARRVRYTMWETTRLPAGMAEAINQRVELLVVPSHHQIEVFRNNGVTVPIEIVTHGVDASAFPYQEPTPRDEFVIGTAGYASKRKGTDCVLAAFRQAFPVERDVRLVVKTKPGAALVAGNDDRISVIEKSLSPAELATLLGTFDVGVFASRGEGFGLYGLQLMSVGRTVICTNWLGMSDYMDKKYNYPLDYELADANGEYVDQYPRSFGLRYFGQWAEPSIDHLVELMRYCYRNREEVRARGRLCADWVREHWTWRRAARQLISAIDARSAS